MIRKKRRVKNLIIISLIIIIIFAAIQIRQTLARYETTTTTERDVDVAFWVVDNSFKSQRLLIEDIYPSTTPFEYTFTVSNFDPGATEAALDDNIAETDMEYEIVLTTTTNLPLSYEIIKNGVTCTNLKQELYTDANGTWYRKMNFATETNPFPQIMDTIVPELDDDGSATGRYVKTKITDTYKLKVTFPQENSAFLEYADLMEDIKIDLSARQIIGN